MSKKNIPEQNSIQSAVDITPQLKHNHPLKEDEHDINCFAITTLQTLFGESHLGLVSADSSMQIVEANNRFCEMLGYSREELRQLRFIDITHPDDIDDNLNLVAQLNDNITAAIKLEMRYIKKGGESIWASCTITAPHDEDGNLYHFVAMVEDISERKATEQALHKLNLQLEQSVHERTIDLEIANEHLRQEIIERKRAEAAERQQRILAEALVRTSAIINSSLDFQEVLKLILENLGQVIVHDTANIMLIQDGIAHIVGTSGYGKRDLDPENLKKTLSFRIDETPNLREIVKTGKAYIIPDVENFPQWVKTPYTDWIRSHVALPIRRKNRVMGFLNLDSAIPHFFSEANIEGLQAFADQVAVAIHNAQMFESMEKTASELAQSNTALQKEIEERKQIEDALRASEERYRILLDTAPIAIFTKDREGRYTSVNAKLLEYWSLNPLGHTDDEILPSRIAYSSRLADLQVMETSESLTAEEQILTASGLRTLYSRRVPLRGRDNEIAGVLGIYLDITEHRRVEAALWQSEEKYRSILENMQEGYYETNLIGNFTFCNQAFCEMLGYMNESLVGKNFREIYPDKATSDHVYSVFNGVFRNAQALDIFEAPVISKNGHNRLLEGSIALIYNNQGKIVGFRGICRDVTERNAAQLALQKAWEKEKELNMMKDRFMVMAAHEFRTPVTIIGTSSQILERYYEQLPEEKRVEHLKRIGEQVQHVAEMIDNISTVLRTSTDSLKFSPSSVKLGELCQSIINNFKYTIGAEYKLIYTYQEGLEPLWADSRLLRIIMSNLLSNAAKYSPKGSEIRIDLGKENHEQILSIADQGIGMSEEEQAHLFEAYYRADDTGYTKGIGLGLKIAKEFVELHGGRIEVKSEANKGTQFSIILPVKSAGQPQMLS